MNKQQLIKHLKLQGFPEKILRAFKKVEREDFVSENYKEYVYDDTSLPIDYGATISQPYVTAFMLNQLELKPNSKQKVLEIGSGSGYVLALLSEITKGKIYGVEIIKELAERSRKTLKKYKDIIIVHQSGKNGLPKFSPYDKILISAACPDLNTAQKLCEQLKENGIIVASVKWSVFKIKKEKGKITTKEFPGFVFVPLVDE
ncbi:MAG: protein-L-isoaspartate O-methyltransferase [Nanoarchaeota archaeon]|nr:protein-L-isoaspartate O-methyltransferase [Nanoarchaeota archaeon]